MKKVVALTMTTDYESVQFTLWIFDFYKKKTHAELKELFNSEEREEMELILNTVEQIPLRKAYYYKEFPNLYKLFRKEEAKGEEWLEFNK